jgi:plasmid maintenance system antidote protein VapI
MINIEDIKGVHPGFVLDRELKAKKISKGPFALMIGEYPQTLGAITKGKRRMNVALALRIEKALDLEEGYLMMLQVYHDIEEEKSKQEQLNKPDLSKIRSALFWDTDIARIKWQSQKKSVIKRVFDRGNKAEQNEIIRFYGKDLVEGILKEYEK